MVVRVATLFQTIQPFTKHPEIKKMYLECSMEKVTVKNFSQLHFIMVALCNRADHNIFIPYSLFPSSSSSFFPRLISAAVDRMSAILLHMAWP